MALLPLSGPDQWWRAPGHLLIDHIFRTDPDIEDGQPRYAADVTVDWAAIAECVADLGQAMADGHIVIDDGFPHVPASQRYDALSPESARIVSSWLMDPPIADPPSSGPTNGRHRVWNAATACPGAILPICGDSLGYASPEDLDAIADWPSLYQTHYQSIVALSWFDQQDALNQHFLYQVSQLAHGIVPER